LPRDVLLGRGVQHHPLKIWKGKNVENLTWFTSTFDFDHKYLWNKWN